MRSKKFISGLVVLTLALSMQSCTFLESLFKDTMVTTVDNVRPECMNEVIPVDFGTLDPATRAKFEAAGKVPVIVDKDCVIDPMLNTVDLTNPGEGWLDSVLGIGLSVATTLVPGVAAFEALGLLLSRRKRKHYGNALKSVAPLNGKVEVKDALVSMASALGLAHSSESTKEVFEEEDEEWEAEEEETE
jgi:hypothetical protein